MGIEIERKFLVDTLLPLHEATHYARMRQGYLCLDIDRTVRVRSVDGERALLTVKGRNDGAMRTEFEYEIPSDDVGELLEMCKGGFVDKVRYYIPHNDLTIELDIFNVDNNGLIVAEIEFDKDDPRADLPEGELVIHHLPDWIGREVTHDPKYYNLSLIMHPYKSWDNPV